MLALQACFVDGRGSQAEGSAMSAPRSAACLMSSSRLCRSLLCLPLASLAGLAAAGAPPACLQVKTGGRALPQYFRRSASAMSCTPHNSCSTPSMKTLCTALRKSWPANPSVAPWCPSWGTGRAANGVVQGELLDLFQDLLPVPALDSGPTSSAQAGVGWEARIRLCARTRLLVPASC